MMACWGDEGLLPLGQVIETKANVEEEESIYMISFALENDFGFGKEFVAVRKAFQVKKVTMDI